MASASSFDAAPRRIKGRGAASQTHQDWRPRPLRVALVTEYYYPHIGGVSEHVHNFARELRRRGHSVDIITGQMPGSVQTPGVVRLGTSVPIYGNGSLARLTLGSGLRRDVRAALGEGAYDLVHVHAPFSPTLPILAIEEADCPTVATVHTWFPRSVLYSSLRRRLRRLVSRVHCLIAVSPTAVRAHERYFDAEWHVVPNGIDLQAFRPDAPRPDGLGEEPFVLFVGRFDPRNALGTMLDAFAALPSRHRDTRLVVVGDGPLRRWYERRARDERRVVFTGRLLEERPQYYANASVYACPTTRASFGVTLLESMACATPVVCSNIVGFGDVVTHGREALMVPRRDARALAGSLTRLLDDGALRRQMGRTAWLTAQRYAWPTVADRVLELYHATLGVTRAAA